MGALWKGVLGTPPSTQGIRTESSDAQTLGAGGPVHPTGAASPSPGVDAPQASTGLTQTPCPSLTGSVTRRLPLVLELALLSEPGNAGPTHGCVFRVNCPGHGGFRRKWPRGGTHSAVCGLTGASELTPHLTGEKEQRSGAQVWFGEI